VSALTADDRPLLLVAAGGLARETAAAARAAGRRVLGCLDDDATRWGTDAAPGLPVLGALEEATRHSDAALVVCAGKGSVRARLVDRLAGFGLGADRYSTVVHPAAALAPDTVLGEGSVLLAGVVATAQVAVGAHVVCMPRVVLTHDDRLGDHVTLCAGVVLGGEVVVGRTAYLGMGASVRERTVVGEGAVIGMGAVVLDDVPPGETWVGVPARALRGATGHP
jgi:sugar O-acyltransferase (sialic acid O-acetyltransferase NeuD family)